jgi:hypothetical protein
MADAPPAMLKKVLLSALALAALYLGIGGLVRFFASDETKIRWLVEGMEEAYDAGRPGSCVGPLARDWRHDGYSLDREMLLGGLFQAARDRDRETRELRTRVDVEPGSLEIAVDGERATLAAVARFERLRAGEWQESWRARIEAELVDGDEGWEIVKSRHEDLAGTHLGR